MTLIKKKFNPLINHSQSQIYSSKKKILVSKSQFNLFKSPN